MRYGYDALDRLISEVRDGSTAVGYEYDAIGNRTRMNRNGATTNYTYDVDDRLLSTGAAIYAYDANGNLLSRTIGGGTTSYEWSADDRLVRTSGAGGGAEFTYDADGNRVARRAGADVTSFLVDANNPTGLSQVVEERDGQGGLQAQYTYGTGIVAATRASGNAFYQPDALGSTRLLTNGAGAITDTYQYDAFGALSGATGSTPNPYCSPASSSNRRSGSTTCALATTIRPPAGSWAAIRSRDRLRIRGRSIRTSTRMPTPSM